MPPPRLNKPIVALFGPTEPRRTGLMAAGNVCASTPLLTCMKSTAILKARGMSAAPSTSDGFGARAEVLLPGA